MLGCIQEEVCSYIISATELFLPTWEQGKQAVALIFWHSYFGLIRHRIWSLEKIAILVWPQSCAEDFNQALGPVGL